MENYSTVKQSQYIRLLLVRDVCSHLPRRGLITLVRSSLVPAATPLRLIGTINDNFGRNCLIVNFMD